MGFYLLELAQTRRWEYVGKVDASKIINSFFDILREFGYTAPDVKVSSYSESYENDKVKISIDIEAVKKVNEYVKYVLVLNLSLEEDKTKNGKATLSFNVAALDVDAEKRLGFLGKGGGVLSKLLKAAYEFLIIKNELDAHQEKLLKEIEGIGKRFIESCKASVSEPSQPPTENPSSEGSTTPKENQNTQAPRT
jgi:hypothetical protein